MKHLNIGILAFHGDVEEHAKASLAAASKLSMPVSIIKVRTKEDLVNLNALILPGGESPTLQKLCQRAGMWEDMKKIKNIFGTCAGAILLAKRIESAALGQETLSLMDIQIDRNAYGRQTDSFEKKIQTKLGSIQAVFIRAPRIKTVGKTIHVLAENDGEITACEDCDRSHFFLATCFHPELTTTKFHEYFLKNIRI